MSMFKIMSIDDRLRYCVELSNKVKTRIYKSKMGAESQQMCSDNLCEIDGILRAIEKEMSTGNIRYAITVDNSWYDGHGGISGSGCFRTTVGLFPNTVYNTEADAEKTMRDIGFSFPEYHQRARIVKIEFNFK